MLQQLLRLRLFVMPVTVLLFCSWENPGMYNYANMGIGKNVSETDTVPSKKQNDKSMPDLNKEMDKIANINNEINQSLSAVNFEAMQKQIEASLKQIEWNKIQQGVNVSLKKTQEEIAKVDFTRLQNEMKTIQDKMNIEAFKSQFNSEQLHKQMEEAMGHAKESMEKAKQQMEQMKEFVGALEADGLIDKKKSYEIEWKEGDLYINGQKQTKDISDKFSKYENSGKIKMLPEGTEHF